MSATIKVGDSVPAAEFPTVQWSEELEDGAACGVPTKLDIAKEWANKKVVLVAVPGAFTPTCHVNHIPAYIKGIQDFKAKGVDVVAVIAANDPFVMSGWSRINHAKGDVLFLTDTYAEWSKKLGLSVDLTELGLGVRTSRYLLLLEDNKVKHVAVEPNPGAVSNTGAEHALAAVDALGWGK
ncbi:alkyl hydroperoxide reductase/thiol specific antioxidant/Mal allergen protein [Rhizoctonia solani 123E]|uniref:Putative peroxiredoxin n=1 Tax=Rhizoctonia solani 123E TaxID=1423351 RepID=A0A074RQL8_9AGAM|nr:alkyl hydroperoxide reductase/thiol specific antioxidant/Mal allergen protein [Rhizoctonia solani 123E]